MKIDITKEVNSNENHVSLEQAGATIFVSAVHTVIL